MLDCKCLSVLLCYAGNKLSEAELLQDELERHVTLPPDSDEFPLL